MNRIELLRARHDAARARVDAIDRGVRERFNGHDVTDRRRAQFSKIAADATRALDCSQSR